MNLRIGLTSPKDLVGLFGALRDIFATLTQLFKRVYASETQTITTPVTAGEPFVLKHGLNKTPTGFHWSPYGDLVVIWATTEDRAIWNETEVVLRASAAATQTDITLFSYD